MKWMNKYSLVEYTLQILINYTTKKRNKIMQHILSNGMFGSILPHKLFLLFIILRLFFLPFFVNVFRGRRPVVCREAILQSRNETFQKLFQKKKKKEKEPRMNNGVSGNEELAMENVKEGREIYLSSYFCVISDVDNVGGITNGNCDAVEFPKKELRKVLCRFFEVLLQKFEKLLFFFVLQEKSEHVSVFQHMTTLKNRG
jgi:hypothetical protein